MIGIVRSSIIYFAIVFAAGFLFGSIRVPFLVPRLGERYAELVESPLMFAVIVFSARYVVRCFDLAGKIGRSLAVGMAAAILLLTVEFIVVLALRGMTIGEFIAQRDPVAGTVYYIMVAIFAVMPAVFARSARG